MGGPVLRHEPGASGRRGDPLRVRRATRSLPTNTDPPPRDGGRAEPLRHVQPVEPGQEERGAQLERAERSRAAERRRGQERRRRRELCNGCHGSPGHRLRGAAGCQFKDHPCEHHRLWSDRSVPELHGLRARDPPADRTRRDHRVRRRRSERDRDLDARPDRRYHSGFRRLRRASEARDDGRRRAPRHLALGGDGRAHTPKRGWSTP